MNGSNKENHSNWFSNLREKLSLKHESVDDRRRHSDDTIHGILELTKDSQFDQLLPLCQQLFDVLKEESDNVILDKLCHLLPALLLAYVRLSRLIVYSDVAETMATVEKKPTLKKLHHTSMKKFSTQQECLEKLQALLLGIYNVCVIPTLSANSQMTDDNCVAVAKFDEGSIFHNSPSSYEFPQVVISRVNNNAQCMKLALNCCELDLTLPSYETLSSYNLWIIFSGIMRLYNMQLHKYSEASLLSLCHLTHFVCQLHDTPSDGSHTAPPTSLRPSYRLPCVSERFLLELCSGLYYYLFNAGLNSAAYEALVTMEIRATYEAMATVLLVINSIRSSMYQQDVGPVGLKTVNALNAALAGNKLALIINATFSPEKLPDDISVSSETSEKEHM